MVGGRFKVDFFSDKRVAEQVRTKETSNGQGIIYTHQVFDSIEERNSYKAQKKIENALSKLNEEEKKLLKINL